MTTSDAVDRLGFMQGRLSPRVNGMIQAFPTEHWRDEYAAAEALGLRLMEWTLDQQDLRENPLMTEAGRAEIAALGARHGLQVSSVTADCFMQAPFWKTPGAQGEALEADFLTVFEAAGAVGAALVVVPLVDNGALDTPEQEERLVAFLRAHEGDFARWGVRVAFECDFPPAELRRFIARLEGPAFGINYDIGNSAALGFDPAEELGDYGERVINVHIKDRPLGGTTVPLGKGAARFDDVFAALARLGYVGNYVLQTARAEDGDHAGALATYRNLALELIGRHGA